MGFKKIISNISKSTYMWIPSIGISIIVIPVCVSQGLIHVSLGCAILPSSVRKLKFGMQANFTNIR